jgi:hypothetical protein
MSNIKIPNTHDPELIQKLINKYPKLLKNVECGVEFPKGWYSLLDRLCNTITYENQINSRRLPKVSQLKSKFAGLRFYIDNRVHESIKSAVRFAESISNIVCESCGSMSARKTNTGWVMTLCRTCYPGADLDDDLVTMLDPNQLLSNMLKEPDEIK